MRRGSQGNILTVYEIGQTGDRHFIATEFIEGVTLRQRLADGRMSLPEGLDIATQVASALAAAHDAGVVHRDVKPENIMVRPDGYVKVLDFGLAKLSLEKNPDESPSTSRASSQHSRPGLVMGTVAYMSPEQARGLDVDARSDIWSFGVVLYEMLAGRPPFDGETSSDCLVAILTSEPAPLGDVQPDVPIALDRLVQRALRKDRTARYQTATTLLTDLGDLRVEEAVTFRSRLPIARGGRARLTPNRWTAKPAIPVALVLLLLVIAGAWSVTHSGRGRANIRAVAVLPLEYRGGDPDAESFSDGISESLINGLSRIPDLRVIARTTAFRYKGHGTDPREVGRALKVDAVLTGRMTQRGETVMVHAELVDVRDGTQVWGEQYRRSLTDLVTLPQTMSREIADSIQPRSSGDQTRDVTTRQTTNPEAYRHYLKGRFFWNKRTSEGVANAIEHFTRAIGLDPAYALAYAGLADCYIVLAGYSVMSPNEAFPKAKAAASTALSLDGTLAEARISLGAIAEYDRD